MTTEELARRFCELAELSVAISRDKAGNVLAVLVLAEDEEGQWQPVGKLEGWPGVGIVVDEMARRKVLMHIRRQLNDNTEAVAKVVRTGAYYTRKTEQPLDAVLAAAIAALEAEAQP